MLRFLLRLAVDSLIIFFLGFTLLFFLLRALGDPAQMLLGQRSDQVTLEAIRVQLHLDKPLWQQYLYTWLDWIPYREGQWKLPSLGTSYLYGRAVSELYLERLPATILLGSAAMLVAGVMGTLGGLWQAYRPSATLHKVALLLLALPGYAIGILLVSLLVLKWGKWTGLPPGGYIRSFDPVCECMTYQWRALVLPVIALALRPTAYFFLLTQQQAQGILKADYVRAARARGKAEFSILVQDVLRNLLPVLATAFTQWLAGLFTGAIFIEELFDWPGVGKLLFTALQSSDFPLLMGIAQFSTLLFVLLHIVGELLSRWSDPRLR